MTPEPEFDEARLRAMFRDVRATEPSRAEIDRALAAGAAADRARRLRCRPRRLGRPAVLVLALAALLGAGVAGLPVLDRESGAPSPLGGPLDAVAAVAAVQPAPKGAAGYRFQRVLDRWTYGTSTAAVTFEQRSETWVDRRFRGLERSSAGTVVDRRGAPEIADRLAREQRFTTSERAYELGDATVFGERPLDELPTDPRRLADLMLRSHFAARRPGFPRAELVYDQTRELLTLLTTANAGPALRAAAFRAIALLGEVEPAGTRTDALGRTGTAVELRFGAEAHPSDPDGRGGLLGGDNAKRPFTFELIFDPGTSTILAWSERRELQFAPLSRANRDERGQLLGQEHLYEQAGYVEAAGERPAARAPAAASIASGPDAIEHEIVLRELTRVGRGTYSQQHVRIERWAQPATGRVRVATTRDGRTTEVVVGADGRVRRRGPDGNITGGHAAAPDLRPAAERYRAAMMRHGARRANVDPVLGQRFAAAERAAGSRSSRMRSWWFDPETGAPLGSGADVVRRAVGVSPPDGMPGPVWRPVLGEPSIRERVIGDRVSPTAAHLSALEPAGGEPRPATRPD